MALQIILGKGATLESATTTGGTYTAIKQVVSITGPEISLEMVDQTHLTSTIKKQRPALAEVPTTTLTFYYDPSETTHADLLTATTAGTIRWFKLKLLDPDTGSVKSTGSFSAYVKNFNVGSIEVGSNVEATVELNLDTMVAWA
jgi:hypothetical protein